MAEHKTFDVVVVGGGPAGSTAAERAARAGFSVLLLDKAGRIKPCGGAIPPRLIRDFEIPAHVLVAKVRSARMFSPSARRVDMPIEGGFVGMVNRQDFDEWLRQRAVQCGAERRQGHFLRIARGGNGHAIVRYAVKAEGSIQPHEVQVSARTVIGADGALSAVARQAVPGGGRVPYVFAYHEIIESPSARNEAAEFDPMRADIYYNGDLSPDFYAWVFPHGSCASVGVGSAVKGFSLRTAVADLRQASGLAACRTIRTEGAPIPLKPLKRWDNGNDIVLAGDAAGVVAPASGEGIYYAMVGGRLAAEAVCERLATGQAHALAGARKRFMKEHGRVFWVLGMMQYFWYASDKRRERFVSMCRDKDVQKLTWDAYMNKRLVRARPAAHAKIFIKDLAHLCGLVPP